MKEKHIASCSFGKDSVATLLLALEHGEPLDEAVYCEVMFDKDISKVETETHFRGRCRSIVTSSMIPQSPLWNGT